ncbi:MAG: HNH endonuclease [Candidatus Sulfotelmatobacter sp.]
MSNLEVQHKEFRSHSGDDSELNLITLCTFCHAQVHDSVLVFLRRGFGVEDNLSRLCSTCPAVSHR